MAHSPRTLVPPLPRNWNGKWMVERPMTATVTLRYPTSTAAGGRENPCPATIPSHTWQSDLVDVSSLRFGEISRCGSFSPRIHRPCSASTTVWRPHHPLFSGSSFRTTLQVKKRRFELVPHQRKP